MRSALLALALLAGCTGNDAGEVHQLGPFEYEVPAGWNSKDQSERGRQIIVWTPEDNPRKESITIVRSEPLPALAKAGTQAVTRHLVDAQLGLRGKFSPASTFRSSQGFAGARVAGSFTPPGQQQRYERVHAVLVDTQGESLVHVLYTARIADPGGASLQLVIDSLQRKGA